jgi:hypothetical protein
MDGRPCRPPTPTDAWRRYRQHGQWRSAPVPALRRWPPAWPTWPWRCRSSRPAPPSPGSSSAAGCGCGVLGFALQAAGLLLLARVPTAGSFATDVLPAFLLVGLGAPIAFVPTTSAALAGDSDTSGLAAGIFNTSQQIGNALTLAALATTAATWTTTQLVRGLDDASALTGGYQVAFALAAAIALTGALTALRLPDASTRGPG